MEILRKERLQSICGGVAVTVSSDFGRTPGYNDGNGKDRWPITPSR